MLALKPSGTDAATAPQGAGKDKFLLIATVGWFMVTFVRIQDMVPFFKAIMPGAISTVALMIAVGMRLKEVPWSDTIVRALLIMLAGITTGIAYALNTYWLFNDFITLFTYGLVFMMAMPILAKNPYCLRALFFIIALSALITAIWGITHSGHGQGAWLGDENDVALWLNTGTPLCYFAARSAHTKRGRYALLATAAFCAVATVASFSRGGFVGLTMGIFGIGLFTRKLVKTLSIAALIGLACLPILASLHPPEGRGKTRTYLEELFSINDQQDTTRLERIYTWTGGWVMFKANPVFGIGAGNYPYTLGLYEDDPELRALNIFDRSFGGRMAHSLYFTMFAELGSVGTISFFVMWVAIFRRSWRLSKTPEAHPMGHIAGGVGAGLLSYGACCAFVSSFWYPPFWLLCGLGVMMNLDLAPASSAAIAAPPRKRLKGWYPDQPVTTLPSRSTPTNRR